MAQDMEWKGYFSDDERYADIINGIVFYGRQVVTKQDLQELDTQLGFLHGKSMIRRWRSAFDRRGVRIRDTVRKAAFGINFAVIGIENQEVIDYSIPLRGMAYDVGEYEKQASRIRREVRKEKGGLKAGEYLYGFRKDSRLYPVITFVLYSGKEMWDGPESLKEMIDFTDVPNELQTMISDYRINLVEIRRLEDTSVFRTDVRQVFDFIRYAENKQKLKELVEQDQHYKSMEEDAFNVVAHYTNAPELIEAKEYCGRDGKFDMCQALKELIEEGRIEGREEGREEGRQEERERFNRLICLLADQDRMADLVRATQDKAYQEQLFREELGVHWSKGTGTRSIWPKRKR